MTIDSIGGTEVNPSCQIYYPWPATLRSLLLHAGLRNIRQPVDRPIDKVLIEKNLKYLSRQYYSPTDIPFIKASASRDLLLNDLSPRSLESPEVRKAIMRMAERGGVTKVPAPRERSGRGRPLYPRQWGSTIATSTFR